MVLSRRSDEDTGCNGERERKKELERVRDFGVRNWRSDIMNKCNKMKEITKRKFKIR